MKQKVMEKKQKAQFYTQRADYILEGMPLPPSDVRCIIEPFAGKGDLIHWIQNQLGVGSAAPPPIPIEAYDIEPHHPFAQTRDTLRHPPDYTNAWVITNPPYLARNKTQIKDLFNIYQTNDLYKCFLWSIMDCRGGVCIIPAGFFFSPRDIDVRLRHAFMTRFHLLKVVYFEESVFEDTPTTVVAVAFQRKAEQTQTQTQEVLWIQMPSKVQAYFRMEAAHKWIVGGDIYHLPISSEFQARIRIRRTLQNDPLDANEQQTYLTLNALDSGKETGRISLMYKDGYVYPAKESSRTYLTLRLKGIHLTNQQQISLAAAFNTFIEERRKATWSLFLPQYRESKDYARKRIPFELAYHIILYLLSFIHSPYKPI